MDVSVLELVWLLGYAYARMLQSASSLHEFAGTTFNLHSLHELAGMTFNLHGPQWTRFVTPKPEGLSDGIRMT